MAYFQGIEARLEKPCRDSIEGMGQELLVYAVEELFPYDSLKDFASTKSNTELKGIFKTDEIKDVRDGITQFRHLDITNIYKFIEHHCNFDRADFKIAGTLAYFLWKIKNERNQFMHGDLKQTLATRDAVIAKLEELKVLYKNVVMKIGEQQCSAHGRKMGTYEHYADGITKRLDDLRPEMVIADLAVDIGLLRSEIKKNSQLATQQTVVGATPLSNVAHQKKKVFILNNIEFSNQQNPKRKGAEIDSGNLRSTFVSIGYDDNDVHIHENLTAAATNHVLDQIQQDTSLDFLLLLILSLGKNTDTFMTSDWQDYSLKSIQERFTDDACPHLKDKAKVIMCGYARGSHKCTETDIYSEDTMHSNRKVPITRHMITIHSSREGCVAYFIPKKGSLFVLALCELLKENSNISIIEVVSLLEGKMKEILDNFGYDDPRQFPEMKIAPPVPNINF